MIRRKNDAEKTVKVPLVVGEARLIVLALQRLARTPSAEGGPSDPAAVLSLSDQIAGRIAEVTR